MRYQYLFAATLTTGFVTAEPTSATWAGKARSIRDENSLAKRDEKQWDANGNIKLTFSKETVKIGDVKLDDMFAFLYEACHTTGQCETQDHTFDGWWQADGNNGDAGPIVVTMGPSGAYPTWIRNGLLDALKAAVMAGAKCGDSTNVQICGRSPINGGDLGCGRPVKTTAFQCEVPAFWGINYQAGDATNAAPPSIGTDVRMELVESTVCEDIMGDLGAVAGAVNGVAGGIFTLLTFLCD